MAYISQKLILLASAITLMIFIPMMANARAIRLSSNLRTRLKLDEEGEESNCWGSMFELKACSGEVIMFFLNGETYLGPSCCEAIRTIRHQCWPTMMGSLGFTNVESDVLQGYCDEEASTHHNSPPFTPPPPPPPPPSPSPLSTTALLVKAASAPTEN